MATPGQVHLDIEGGVATLTLDRPSRRNALDGPMWAAIGARATEAAGKGARVLIITGAGPHFCSGLDLNMDNPLLMEVAGTVMAGEAGRPKGEETIRTLKSWMAPIRAFPGLSIAAIEGVCIGGGLEVALHCDVRIAAKDAWVSLPEARWGMVPDVGGSTLLTRLVGPGRAAMIAASGRRYPADEAYALGMLELLVAPGGALEAARLLAQDTLRSAPTATRLALGQIRSVPGRDIDDCFTTETIAGAKALASGEVMEGMAAFAEKRAPAWSPDAG
jgi:enoyl-CoA hydratase/carnithine racemase